MDTFNPRTLVVCDDVRYENEAEWFKTHGKLLCLTVDQEEQWERYQTSDKFDPTLDKQDWMRYHEHATELYWNEVAFTPKVNATINTTGLSPNEVEEFARRYIATL